MQFEATDATMMLPCGTIFHPWYSPIFFFIYGLSSGAVVPLDDLEVDGMTVVDADG